MAFHELLHRPQQQAASGQAQHLLSLMSSPTAPRHVTRPQTSTPDPPLNQTVPPFPRVTPPHERSPADREQFQSPSRLNQPAYRFSPAARQPTGKVALRPTNQRKKSSAFRGPNGSSSSSSSSLSDDQVTPSGPRDGNFWGSGPDQVGATITFDQQLRMRDGPISRRFLQEQAVSNPQELWIWVHGIPSDWTTLDVYNAFACFGNVSRIDLKILQGRVNGANVTFRPAPQDTTWVGLAFKVNDKNGRKHELQTKNETKPPMVHKSIKSERQLPDRIVVPLESIDFGVKKSEETMLGMHSIHSTASQAKLMMDLSRKALSLTFPVEMAFASHSGKPKIQEAQFEMHIIPAQVVNSCLTVGEDSSRSLYIVCETPPVVRRKTSKPSKTFDRQVSVWDENKLWFRQTSIDLDPSIKKGSIKLREKHCIIDLGRWLTYRLSISQQTFESSQFQDLLQALDDHNIKPSMDKNMNLKVGDTDDLWEWLDQTAPNESDRKESSFLAEMHQLQHTTLHHQVRYQLEVCLSLGLLHECNMSKSFVEKLANLDKPANANKLVDLEKREPIRAVRLLEKVADEKIRYYNPNDIFRLQHRVSLVQKKRPAYCSQIPSAVVTPTTIYFATPVLETSNRVIRQYQHVEDRFLRVKFTDERHKGRIFAQDGRQEDEVFSRVSRAMTNGITIGDHHYEFLAFGSSQFREHGAYFFQSGNDVSAQMIRDWMGDFTSIKVVAKYCARLGQCFSTTRAIPNSIKTEKIPDIKRNGFCFTDGAGKISPFLARMAAQALGLNMSEQDHPSMFQFRLGGCKGVLAVDASLKANTIHIRPSQEKFPAKFQSLEICRYSQYSTAYLNQQIILVLSSLKIRDGIFVTKTRNMLAEFHEAMKDESKAMQLLQRNIDYNQMTMTLAVMILDGFMETQEPFFISCLRLWRSWSLKFLKEKARICVDQGAFLLGGPDETGILKGDFTTAGASCKDEDLPEVFLQIPDPENPGKYRAMQGICIIARNPSLHPGDIRKVRAVDVPALHHMRNVLILPVTGHRDLANMCSGGDLDGDDYLVIWDPELIPEGNSHPPMNYEGPTPTENEGGVTPADMAKFFVQHIKYDNLARIATWHRYWADKEEAGVGVGYEKCIELAHLHSKAVDYAKTGVPAEVPAQLRPRRFPHWAERKNAAASNTYRSRKILGQLYDAVNCEAFQAAWENESGEENKFDERILTACEPSEQMLQGAREVKALYDEAMRRIMTQFGINTEHEVFTTFVLDHHQEVSDYKLAEKMGEVAENLKQHHRDLCYEKAGVESRIKDWDKLKQFIVAMYRVTAQEIGAAYAETKQKVIIGGSPVSKRPLDSDNMPFMSFPWIFTRELGQIASKQNNPWRLEAVPRPTMPKKLDANKLVYDRMDEDFALEPLPEVNTDEGLLHAGDTLDLFHGEARSGTASHVGSKGLVPSAVPANLTPIIEAPLGKDAWPEYIRAAHLAEATAASREAEEEVKRKAQTYREAGLPADDFDDSHDLGTEKIVSGVKGLKVREADEALIKESAAKENAVKVSAAGEAQAKEGEGSDWDGEEVEIEFDAEPSRLDRLAALLGLGEDE